MAMTTWGAQQAKEQKSCHPRLPPLSTNDYFTIIDLIIKTSWVTCYDIIGSTNFDVFTQWSYEFLRLFSMASRKSLNMKKKIIKNQSQKLQSINWNIKSDLYDKGINLTVKFFGVILHGSFTSLFDFTENVFHFPGPPHLVAGQTHHTLVL